MKKFLIGLVAGFFLTVLTAVILFFALLRLGKRTPTVDDNSTLVMSLEGDLPEQAPVEIPIPFLQQETPVTIRETWDTLRRAAGDSRVKALVLLPHDLEIGWGKLEEIHDDLVQFKRSGKPVYAFLRNPGAREYYLASVADSIFMTPTDMLDVKGLRAEMVFLPDTLNKIGVQMEVLHVGKYKDAGDMFTRTSATPETLEVTNEILDRYYGDLIDTIAAGRHKKSADVRALIDQGPFLGSQALSDGLVDSLEFEDQMYGELSKRIQQTSLHKISNRDYLKAAGARRGNARRIALVVGQGAILRGSPQGFQDGVMTSGGMIQRLREVENDSEIRGVILRIDSPGGDGVASDDILHAVENLSRKKPVVISMSDLAASGGYFIAMSGDPIVAYPNTLTGSIGVLMVKPNLHGLYDKLGLKLQTLSRGRYADLESTSKPMDDAARAKFTESLNQFYKSFVTRVADGRHRQYADIDQLAQGRVWLGEQAKQNGLVDQLGGLDRAVEMIRAKAQIPQGTRIELVPYPRRRSLLEVLLSRENEQPDLSLDSRVDAFLKQLHLPARSWLETVLKGGMLRIMPYSIRVW